MDAILVKGPLLISEKGKTRLTPATSDKAGESVRIFAERVVD